MLALLVQLAWQRGPSVAGFYPKSGCQCWAEGPGRKAAAVTRVAQSSFRAMLAYTYLYLCIYMYVWVVAQKSGTKILSNGNSRAQDLRCAHWLFSLEPFPWLMPSFGFLPLLPYGSCRICSKVLLPMAQRGLLRFRQELSLEEPAMRLMGSTIDSELSRLNWVSTRVMDTGYKRCFRWCAEK